MTNPTQWVLALDMLGPPLTQNKAHRMHHHAIGKIRREWREASAVLARAQRIPRMDAIAVTCWVEDSDRRRLPDTDAASPALKPVIDGLVDAGVVPDDTGEYVRSITYLPSRHVPDVRSALVVIVQDFLGSGLTPLPEPV